MRVIAEWEPAPGTLISRPRVIYRGWQVDGVLIEASELVCSVPGDLDRDGDVDLSDLAQLLSNYGITGGAGYPRGEFDGDGDVDLSDLAALLANYGFSRGA